MINLVVTHPGDSDQDIRWIDALPRHCSVHVYTTPGTPVPLDGTRAIDITRLPGLQHASQAHLHHLMHGRLHGRQACTLYCDDAPERWSPDFADLMHTSEHWGDVQPLSWAGRALDDAAPDRADEQATWDTRDWLGGLPVEPLRFSLRDLGELGHFDRQAYRMSQRYRQAHGLTQDTHLAGHFLALCGLTALAAQARQADLGVQACGDLVAVRNSQLDAARHAIAPQLRHIDQLLASHALYRWMWSRLWLHVLGLPFNRVDALPRPDKAVDRHEQRLMDAGVAHALASIDAVVARTLPPVHVPADVTPTAPDLRPETADQPDPERVIAQFLHAEA